MTAEDKRKKAFLNRRLRLQTSGIYRDSAIPGCKIKIKTGGSGGSRRLPPWFGPEVSAQVASLQSPILCSGQNQRRPTIGSSSRL